jgi:putative ABC transport system permease protein
MSIATVFVFGALPAWQASRGNLADFLKEGGRGTGSAKHRRLQDGLVVVQVAVALVLLTGAGLLVESFVHFRQMDLGFRPSGVLTAQIALSAEQYPTKERQASFQSSLVEQLAARPGVQSASASSALPGDQTSLSLFMVPFFIVGDLAPDPRHTPNAYTVAVSPDYFRTMGISLSRGRSVLPTDDSRAARIAVVDELLSRRFFRANDPVGRRVTWGGPDTLEIVGVVAPVKQNGLTAEDVPVMYVPNAQFPNIYFDVEVRTSGDPAALTAMVKSAVTNLDPMVPVSDVQTMSARVAQQVGTTRFSSVLASLFAVVALVLGAVGIYSVLAYIVSQRKREIAVRIALGAGRTRVMVNVLRQATALTVIGIALGSGGAWLLTRALAGLFVGVSPHDPGIFVGAAALFAVVALVAASVPAFRTTRISPVVALASI